MLIFVIIVEKYLTLNLRKEDNFIFASNVKIGTTVIRPNLIVKISLKNCWFYKFITQTQFQDQTSSFNSFNFSKLW